MNNSEEKQLLVAFETMINTADEALAEKLIVKNSQFVSDTGCPDIFGILMQTGLMPV